MFLNIDQNSADLAGGWRKCVHVCMRFAIPGPADAQPLRFSATCPTFCLPERQAGRPLNAHEEPDQPFSPGHLALIHQETASPPFPPADAASRADRHVSPSIHAGGLLYPASASMHDEEPFCGSMGAAWRDVSRCVDCPRKGNRANVKQLTLAL